MNVKTIALGDLFTDEELELAEKLYEELKDTSRFATVCCVQVVMPALPRINQVTGQTNSAKYWAYALEYAIGRGL